MHCHDTLTLGSEEKKAYMNAESPAEIFPEYYLIKVDQFRESVKDKFDEWVYFLKNSTIKPGFHAQGIQSAAHKLDMLQLDEPGRRAYERFKENLMYEASMTTVPYGIGRVDGFLQGELQGIEKGIEQGIEQTQQALVKKLLLKGLPLNEIANLTDLPLSKIEELQQKDQPIKNIKK